MFELLLQADRALAGGNLDQAERTYWQLSELDPTNAIAFAGLARVAMERGDVRLARLFASRALVMDPESVAATRILETIDASEEDPSHEQRSLPVDVPLIAAEHLEALSHRRFIRRADSDAVPPSEPPAASADDAAPLSEPAPEPIPEAQAARADEEALPGEAAPEPLPEQPARADNEALPGGEAAPLSEAAPEPLPQLPEEPWPERGRIGRDVAAAAAEMETETAEMETGTTDSSLRRRPSGRPEFHLTPVPERGHRRFEREEMKAPPLANDPFAAAESEAVVEALGAFDDSDFVEQPPREPSQRQGPDAAEDVGADASSAEGYPDEGDGADAGESVALRIALLGDEFVPEIEDAGPESLAEPDDLLDLRLSFLAGESDLEAAEEVASEASVPTGPQEDNIIATRMAVLAGDAELEADEIEASKGIRELETEPEFEGAVAPEPEAEGDGTVQPEPPGIDDALGPAASNVPDRRLSEWEAESAALSEAVAMVEGDLEGAGESGVGGAVQSSPSAESGSAASGIDDAASGETPEPAKEEPEPEHRRRGFLRRITGG